MRLLFLLPALMTVWPAQGADIVFERDVKPIFQKNCVECHGAKQQMATLRLDRKEFAMTAGRGKLAIIPGGAIRSLVYLRVSGTTEGTRMPPAGPLGAEDIATIKGWIDQGAVWPDEPRPDQGWKADARVDPLLAQIRKGNFAPVQKAVTANAELARARNADGTTLLMQAALYGTADNVQWLLSHDADAKAIDAEGTTALHWAVEDGAKVGALLDAGADPNATSGDGRTALFIALERLRSGDVLKALIDHGVNLVPERGQAEPLTLAARNSDIESMKLLVEQKPYDGKYTPAALAAVAGADCLACVQIMIEQGMSKTALSDAFRSAALSARPEILNVLLKAGADVNAKDGAGSSALMRAVTSDFADVPRIQLFLDHGADVNLRDRNGDTALRKARQKGESQVAALLINAGEKE